MFVHYMVVFLLTVLYSTNMIISEIEETGVSQGVESDLAE